MKGYRGRGPLQRKRRIVMAMLGGLFIASWALLWATTVDEK
jgi:predicted metal-binding membrane protein